MNTVRYSEDQANYRLRSSVSCTESEGRCVENSLKVQEMGLVERNKWEKFSRNKLEKQWTKAIGARNTGET
jgi:hypothetical protein